MSGIDPYVPERGNLGYTAGSYVLDLDYSVSSNRLDGRAEVEAVATMPLRRLALDLVGLRASKVAVNGRAAKWRQHAGKLDVALPEPVVAGDALVVEVRYAGNPRPAPSTWGPVGWEELHDGVLVAAQPSGAGTWFPVNDLAAQKATFRVTVTAASSYRVLVNGVLVDHTVHGSRTTWTYEQAEPTSPYLMAVHVGRYEVVDLAPDPAVRLVSTSEHLPAARRAFARLPEMVDAFVDRFGPYPFAAGYTVVVCPEPLEVPLEAQGQASFGTNHLDGTHERLVAHELAHQWFGNSVTAARWRDIWLHEGFACYSEWLWSEWSGGRPAAGHAAEHHARLAALPQDLVLSDPGPADLFDDRVYKRGALALHAVRVALGDDAFFALLRSWVADHAHGTVTTDDFLAAAGVDLTAWLDEPALP